MPCYKIHRQHAHDVEVRRCVKAGPSRDNQSENFDQADRSRNPALSRTPNIASTVKVTTSKAVRTAAGKANSAVIEQ